MPEIICPGCGLSRDIPAERLPSQTTRVTCPRCKRTFLFPQGSQAPEAVSGEAEMTDIGELFARSWEIYRRRLSTLVPLYFISLLIVLAPIALLVVGGYYLSVYSDFNKAFAIAGIITGALVGAVAMYWVYASVIYAVVDESLGIKAALGKGWFNLGSFIWVLSIAPFIIGGGYILFIIPGVILSVLFVFSQYILAQEGVRGMDSLLKSREYVRGYGMPVFLRLLVIWGAAMIVSTLFSLVPIVGPVASYFITPYILIFTCLIYRDLRRIKGDVAFDSSASAKTLWISVGSFGYLLLFAGIAALWVNGFFNHIPLP